MFNLFYNILIFVGNGIISLFEKTVIFLFQVIPEDFTLFKKNIKRLRKLKSSSQKIIMRVNKKLKKAKTMTLLKIKKYKLIKQKHEPVSSKRIRKYHSNQLEKPLTVFRYITFYVLGIVSAIVFLVFPYEVYAWYKQLPNPNMLTADSGNKSTKILDRQGRLLYEIYVDKRYDPIKLDQIPSYFVEATLAVEDANFYDHQGVSPIGMLRAARETLVEGNVQGGSTITQQLIKNVLLTSEQTIERKAKEVVLAVLVESKYSKNEILELYLNNISYGGTAWGVQAAAQKYFGKNAWELSLAESSILAGLPSAPSTYSPLSNLDGAKNRQKYVLDRMVELGYLTSSESSEAFDEELIFAEQIEYIRAPHFVDYVRNELEKKYGKRYVDFGGLTVVTSLDLELQDQVQQIVREEVEKSSNLNISNGAAVVLDVDSSSILAYVGSVDYFKEKWGAFDVASALRQPGSSIKPVTYALALTKDFTAGSLIDDSPVSFKQKGSPAYKPVNYDGRYHGKVSLRQALANSYNIPAVRLANSLGPDNIVALGKEMGLTNWEVDGTYGLSITLGGKEVRLVDHSNMYATLARKGEYRETSPFLSIKDGRGFEIYKSGSSSSSGAGRSVISDEVAYLLWDILSDEQARLPAFGTRNFLTVAGHKIAVKTGTTDSKRDNWTMGYTPSYVVGVWVGNNNNDPMNPRLASGLSGAAPMWNRIMSFVLTEKPSEDFERPDNIFEKKDDKCNKSELFIKGSKVPASLCFESGEKDNNDD